MTTEAETLTGRALDRAVGEALFGFTEIRELGYDGWVGKKGGEYWTWLPEYSTSWDAAALVVAAMRRRGCLVVLHAMPGKQWHAAIGGDGAGFAETADELPTAICRAALRALAAEQEAGQ